MGGQETMFTYRPVFHILMKTEVYLTVGLQAVRLTYVQDVQSPSPPTRGTSCTVDGANGAPRRRVAPLYRGLGAPHQMRTDLRTGASPSAT